MTDYIQYKCKKHPRSVASKWGDKCKICCISIYDKWCLKCNSWAGLMGSHKHCPKCDSAPKCHELRNHNMMWGDGDVICTKCKTYVRGWDAG